MIILHNPDYKTSEKTVGGGVYRDRPHPPVNVNINPLAKSLTILEGYSNN